MKNIWKWLMIMLLTLAMIGCPATKTEDDDEDEDSPVVTTTTVAVWADEDVKLDGVFSMTLPTAKISTQWGGSPASPAFAVMLMNDTAITQISAGTIDDLKKLPAGSPAYQVMPSKTGNNTFFTSDEGAWESLCAGVVGEISGTNATLYLDGSKLLKSQIKGIGKDFGTKGEQMLATEDEVDLTGYTAVALAFAGFDLTVDETFTADYPYVAELWSASLYKMKSGATYPTTISPSPALVDNMTITVSLYDGEEATTASAIFKISNVSYFNGYKIPVNFYANGSAETAENAAANGNLTVRINTEAANIPEAGWEGEQKPKTNWTYTISKKIKIGADEGWIGYNNATTGDAYDWTKRK